jgi:hypothetical protein
LVSKFVFQEYLAYLADLVRLCLVPVFLQVDLFLDIGSPEQVMASARTHLEAKPQQQVAQIVESDIGVRSAAEYSLEELFMLAHAGMPLLYPEPYTLSVPPCRRG